MRAANLEVYISGMNAPKVDPEDSFQFVIASPNVVSALQAAAAQPDQAEPPAHDAFTRLRRRLNPTTPHSGTKRNPK